MTRPLNTEAPHQAGVLLLKWAAKNAPRAIESLAEQLNVSSRTVRKWINGECQPAVGRALEIQRIAKVPLGAWEQCRFDMTTRDP